MKAQPAFAGRQVEKQIAPKAAAYVGQCFLCPDAKAYRDIKNTVAPNRINSIRRTNAAKGFKADSSK
jgi:hypothetical protein